MAYSLTTIWCKGITIHTVMLSTQEPLQDDTIAECEEDSKIMIS